MHALKTSLKQKTILIIGTGGTIAGTGEEGKTSGYDSAQIKISELVSNVGGLNSLAHINSAELFSVDSCDIDLGKLQKLARFINEKAQSDEIDGFVITHGTDTLEETAYFLNLTVKTHKPVIITGAMRPDTAISADGPFNLYQSVALAQNDEAAGKGIMVVFSDAIYGARDICKINTFRTDAFNQKDLGCLGYMRDDKAFFYSSSTKKHTLSSEFDIDGIPELPRVEIAMFYVGADSSIIDFISENSDGMIIAGAGCGGSSTAWDKKAAELIQKGFPIVRSSRIANGLVTYPYEEICQKGVYSNNLSPQKARILLTLALTKTHDIYEIQKMFEKY